MNPFERFSLPIMPLVDRDLLKSRYLAEAERLHPDRLQGSLEEKEAAGGKLAELNEAFETLHSHRLRLALLGELSTGNAAARTGRVSGIAADRMMKVAEVCRKTDAVLAQRSRAEGALEIAMLSGDIFEATEMVSSIRGEIAEWERELESELELLQGKWEKGEKDAKAVENLYQFFSYSEKARKQLEEKFLKLAESLS